MTAPVDPLTALAALAARYPAWSLRPAPAGFAAEHTSGDGRHIRYIAARTVEELAAKLETAEVVEP
jgi:hypothetical protein